MIDFNSPIRLRGIHAAYAQYLSKERGQLREGGVNIFNRIMDAYLYAVLVGLYYKETALVDDSVVIAADVFDNDDQTKITSSNVDSSTVRESNSLLNGYISKMVNSRNRINEKIIFVHVNNTEEICDLMHSFLD